MALMISVRKFSSKWAIDTPIVAAEAGTRQDGSESRDGEGLACEMRHDRPPMFDPPNPALGPSVASAARTRADDGVHVVQHPPAPGLRQCSVRRRAFGFSRSSTFDQTLVLAAIRPASVTAVAA